MKQRRITVVIPAKNEEATIGRILEEARPCADGVIVVDDGSSDRTRAVAEQHGAAVVSNEIRRGYLGAIKAGLRMAPDGIVVTLDADGEHDPADIPRLVQPILDGKADLVFGRRGHVPRISERILNRLARWQVGVEDSGSGFRALDSALAQKLDLQGACTCGLLALEAACHGARIVEVPVTIRPAGRRRRVAWHHAKQILPVLRWTLKARRRRPGAPPGFVDNFVDNSLDRS
jgi:hypothetical protein